MNKLLTVLRRNQCSAPSKCIFTAIRTFLSSIYSSPSYVNSITSPASECEEMALQIIPIDRCYERGLPVSSMMFDKMIRSITTKEHARGSLYYFHKFRHSLNGYYLHPWSVFTFITKCLQTDANILLDALHEKVHFGIFPNSFMMNLILDHFLEADNIESAAKIASEMFLLETLDNKVAQALAITALSKFWHPNSAEDKVIPSFEDLAMKRNFGGVLFVVGTYSSNPSLIIIGNSILGSIEAEHGIRAIYQDPWGPLSTEPGYLKRAVKCLISLQTPVSQQCVDVLLECVASNDEMRSNVEKTIENLKSKNLIKEDENLTLKGIADTLMEQLPLIREEENNKFVNDLMTWKSDRDLLEEIEKELNESYKVLRAEHFRNIEVETKAHHMAVETLGFWDLAKNEENEQSESEEKPVYYLREDYVDGSIDDLELVERFRERRGLVDNALLRSSE